MLDLVMMWANRLIVFYKKPGFGVELTLLYFLRLKHLIKKVSFYDKMESKEICILI